MHSSLNRLLFPLGAHSTDAQMLCISLDFFLQICFCSVHLRRAREEKKRNETKFIMHTHTQNHNINNNISLGFILFYMKSSAADWQHTYIPNNNSLLPVVWYCLNSENKNVYRKSHLSVIHRPHHPHKRINSFNFYMAVFAGMCLCVCEEK